MKVAAGIDGGGTSTRVVLFDPNGLPLGRGEAGGSNYHTIGPIGTRENLSLAFAQAWRNSGLEPRPVEAAFFGMAGVVSAVGVETIRSIALEARLAVSEGIEVDHDIRIALAGGLAGAPGIALIVGTGSSCYGRNAEGATWRSGGWGHVLDDLGSGYDLGLQAMVAATRALDGRGPPTSLLSRVLEFLQLDDLQDIMHKLYVEGVTRARIAELAPVVLAAADSGDEAAGAILARGARELAAMVAAVAKELFPREPEVRVAAAGGLMNHSRSYFKRAAEEIAQTTPGAQLLQPGLEPVLGAGLLALTRLGVTLNEDQIDHLASHRFTA
jgi:glucosamine kinase